MGQNLTVDIRTKFIYENWRGLELSTPYMGVSINGSPFADMAILIFAGAELENEWSEFTEICGHLTLDKNKTNIEQFEQWRGERSYVLS